VAEPLQHIKMLLSGVTRTRRCVNDPSGPPPAERGGHPVAGAVMRSCVLGP